MFLAAKSGTMLDLVYSDAHMTKFIAELDECLSGFNDLLGECQIVG